MFVGKTLDFIEFDEMIDELIFTDRTYSFQLSQEGLYMIHGYSGVQYVWRDEENKDFTAILAIEDGIEKMSIALASDIVHMIIDFTDLGTSKPQRFWRALSKKVAKNVIRSISQDLPPAYETWGALSYNEKFDIIFGILVEGIKAALTAAPHYALIYMQEKINPVTAMKLGLVQEKADGSLKSRLLTSLKPGKLLAILDKTSSIGRMTERFAGLFGRIINVLGLEMSLGPTPLESAIVVVGDPFSPQIVSFSPLAGNPGDLVVLQGKRFADELEDNEVWFGNVKAEVVAIEGRDQLTVRVPMYQSNFQPYEDYTIRIETPGMMEPGFSTQDFYLYRIPILDRVEPYRNFSSVPSDSQSLFAGYRTEINIHGWQLYSRIGIWDKVFIGDQVLEMSQFNYPPSLRAFLPENLEPGVHDLYIVSPENDDYVTPSVPIEIIGPPEAYRLDRDSARVGDMVLIEGMFLGRHYRVTVGETTARRTRILSGGEIVFEMPTIGEPDDLLEVRVHNPAGISEPLSIRRDPGFADLTQPEMPSRDSIILPKGWTIYVRSTSSGFDPSTNYLTLDEAIAIASGAVDPYSPPWDDQNEEWYHHYIQKKNRHYDPVRAEYYYTYDWEEDLNRLRKVYLPGGPGDEYRTHFRIDHYHDDHGGGVTEPNQTLRVNLDETDANKEKGDFVIGERGGPDYANTIVIQGGGTFYAENAELPNYTTIDMKDANLVLSGNGLQFGHSCDVKINNITVAGGAGVLINGSDNRLTANSLSSVHDGVVIQSGHENVVGLNSLQTAENGIIINDGFKNSVYIGNSIDSGLSGAVLMNSVDNYISPKMIAAGEYGVYIEGGGWNKLDSFCCGKPFFPGMI